MTLSLLSPPASEPVSLDDLKHHLRVSTDADDTSLSGLSVAARHALEARAGFAFMPQQWRYSAERSGQYDIILPVTPVLSVDEVGITHPDGTYKPLAFEDLIIETGSIGRVKLRQLGSKTLKLFGQHHGRLQVTFTAGHEGADLIPAELRHAIRLLTAHFYENRESAGEARVFSIPRSVDALIAPYRRLSV